MCPSSSGDRASASGAESRRFESYLGHHSDFPRTRMMRVFFFREEIAAVPPIAEHAAALSHKKASPRADSLGRGVHTFRPMYCREPCPADANCRLCSFCIFDESATTLTTMRPSPPKRQPSSDIKWQAYFAKRLAASSMAMFTIASAANHTPSAEVSMLT